MKRFLFAVVLALLSSGASAQRLSTRRGATDVAPAFSLEKLIDARAKLIQRYVGTYAWGVSVCGSVGSYFDGDASWLTVYVYSDSISVFSEDFSKFATKSAGGMLGVDGV